MASKCQRYRLFFFIPVPGTTGIAGPLPTLCSCIGGTWKASHGSRSIWVTWVSMWCSSQWLTIPTWPPLLVGVGPHLRSCCSTKTIAGCMITSSFFSKDVAMSPSTPLEGFCELFRSIWIIPFFPKQLTHHLACTLLQRQAIHSFETLLRVDRRFVSPKKGAKCWSWKQFGVAGWLSFWRHSGGMDVC